MEPYLFYGIVRPERAQLSLRIALEFTHVGSGVPDTAEVSIILNQVVVWVRSDFVWDIFDLRNVVKNIVQNELALVGFVRGYAYDFEVTRVVSPSRQIDHVFGIDIPALSKRNSAVDLMTAIGPLRSLAEGPLGVFVHRCLADLASSMKDAENTGFYCYRAVESLRHHCAARHSLQGSDKSTQWRKFRELSGASEETLRDLKSAADPLRHGEGSHVTSQVREELFSKTWDVVEGYFQKEAAAGA